MKIILNPYKPDNSVMQDLLRRASVQYKIQILAQVNHKDTPADESDVLNVPKLVDAMGKLVADKELTVDEVYILSSKDDFERLRAAGDEHGWPDLPGIVVKYVCC